MVHMAADCYSKTVKEKDHEKKRHPEKKKNGQSSCWPNQQRAHAAVGNEDEERALVSSADNTDNEFGALFIEDEPEPPTVKWAGRAFGHLTKWCFDSGATGSCTGDRSLFEEIKSYNGTLSVVNGECMAIKGCGVV